MELLLKFSHHFGEMQKNLFRKNSIKREKNFKNVKKNKFFFKNTIKPEKIYPKKRMV